MMNDQRGFTLVEILMVVAIIGILAVVLAPKLGNVSNNSSVNAVETDFRTMKSGIQQHYIDNRDEDLTMERMSKYMDDSFEEDAASTPEFLQFRTVHKEDPWGNPYFLYISNSGDRYVMLHSYGPNEMEDINGNIMGDDILYIFYPNG